MQDLILLRRTVLLPPKEVAILEATSRGFCFTGCACNSFAISQIEIALYELSANHGCDFWVYCDKTEAPELMNGVVQG